jgi:hypothetical protein
VPRATCRKFGDKFPGLGLLGEEGPIFPSDSVAVLPYPCPECPSRSKNSIPPRLKSRMPSVPENLEDSVIVSDSRHENAGQTTASRVTLRSKCFSICDYPPSSILFSGLLFLSVIADLLLPNSLRRTECSISGIIMASLLQLQTQAARAVNSSSIKHNAHEIIGSRASSSSPSSASTSMEIARCCRCQQALIFHTGASPTSLEPVQFGLNSYYCHRCASVVGFKK